MFVLGIELIVILKGIVKLLNLGVFFLLNEKWKFDNFGKLFNICVNCLWIFERVIFLSNEVLRMFLFLMLVNWFGYIIKFWIVLRRLCLKLLFNLLRLI